MMSSFYMNPYLALTKKHKKMKSNIKIHKTLVFCKIALCILLFIGSSIVVDAQVDIPFAPRKSSNATPPYTNVNNYRLQGDFVMLGNMNLTLSNYADGTNNSQNNMIFVDQDGISSTVNSSSADLVFPNPSCSEIIYAGLYWSGRAENGGSTNMTINGRRKDQIKIKKGNSATYTTITASQLSGNSEINYPGTNRGQMYAAYADVTNFVKTNGAGTYFAADMALVEGNGTEIGYYGGWGMVVIFKDNSLPWRDITVFDGYAYVVGGNASNILNVSGFNSVQNGNVRTTIGMMAGEGDVGISGDYFWARKNTGADDNNNSNWVPLSHSLNSATNFFNSSINVGGTPRNLNRQNNTGIDIAKFDLPNTGNSIIGNNQTSTKFKYGSTQDTYIIYNIVFAVDAYVPTVIGENTGSTYNSFTPVNGGTVLPGQEYELKLDMKNKGTETVSNTKVKIPIPYNHHYTGYTLANLASDFPNNTTVTWIPPVGAPPGAVPATTPGGSLEWNIGLLPLHANVNDILATLKYRLKVSTDCILLLTNSCSIHPKINGQITGTGTTSTTPVNTTFVTGYGNQTCPGPVFGDFEMTIDTSTLNCLPSVYDNIKHYETGSSPYPRANVVGDYPPGTKFFSSPPSSYGSNVDVVTGDFPVPSGNNAVVTYYAVSPGMPDGCYLTLTISRTVCYDTAVPTALGPNTDVGVTSLKHASSTTWPMNRSSGFIAIESKTKGFVITRVSNPVTAITYPQEGMMIFNTTTNKLQIYSDNQWRNFTQAGCP